MSSSRTESRFEPRVELSIGGMTCAACAARIEKKLNRLEGVTAAVNYATEKAVIIAPRVSVDDLIATVEKTGYTAIRLERSTTGPERSTESGADVSLPATRTRLVLSAALSAPVILLAMVSALQFTYWQWVSLALATPVVLWGAWPFHVAAWKNLRSGTATMDTLVSVGTLAAFGWSLYALLIGTAGMPGMKHPFTLTVGSTTGADTIYLEVAAGVTTFVLAGRYIEYRAKRRAGAALRAILELGAKDATVLRAGAETHIPINQLHVGDRFVVRPGEKIATDGVVVDGTSAVDASLVTGESVPIEVMPGDEVTGATLNTSGLIVVAATRVGADTHLAWMSRMVTEAQNGKADIQRLADRISGIFVPIVIAFSLGTLGYWLVAGATATAAFTAAVAVLIIACPCALGLATPTALLVGSGRGAGMGILIKGPEVLEATRRVDTIVLDKTGTVTTGVMSLVDVTPAAGTRRAEVLRLAGAVAAASEHPISRAIATAAKTSAGTLPAVTGFTSLTGLGARGSVAGHLVLLGRPQLLTADHGPLPVDLATARDTATARGHTVVLVGWDAEIRGLIAIADTIRPTSALAVTRLRRLGLTPVLLTGDNAAAARGVAADVGIDEVIADVLPADKVDVIRRLRDQGKVVAMVGDGVNDAPALAEADLGLALGTGTDSAIEAADLTLVRGDLTAAADAIRLSRRTLATIKGNLFWAFAYNIAALPLAAAGLLNPMIAGAAMALSSVFVVTNSLRLRRFQPMV